LGLIS